MHIGIDLGARFHLLADDRLKSLVLAIFDDLGASLAVALKDSEDDSFTLVDLSNYA